ncbi:similar to Saccharomyces cerevisiae YJL031C BET4 Alpha subunit of Type II geranylgeranyltransferase required for vesicular transport between the endoplasmic reticulum and the Golgi [Maudiozyma barnettii]|uniref:Geranylgeranyl transferase type-2 subunit alpha n=1 Tax=Maudiozyma barnettii TaxID=61262 RepID=A0A8H2ZER9_9SACH|nr:Rab geranylgeranyltransferase BET4 [Kazachstania barnettii]CAB4252536.1 similar to Saccharomyces cerevisiae YJL031C BET4 Alpha subunit of Type II geranylgeranyltransferase required for vesicular transport between the endoplasmic reticulum and the Golgi [Kazachstania barnettii]CAD1779272.1 similar to Saccharomyces cerevisiae YJL031C BET4 Alpha subunit of Type II geranylgeranyltransferase required for vesicular transport between the endoplasmic reticulum and the Golgi [Kazachstania barnettii]
MHGIKRKQYSREILKQKRLQDQLKIKTYNKLVDETLTIRDNKIFTSESLQLTSKVLELNPEFNTVWNYRRDIILQLQDTAPPEFWENELQFTMEKLKRFPKVYWIWNHRIWVLNNYSQASTKIWIRELSIVDKLLSMDARNYHGWHYRRLIVKNLETLKNQLMDKEELGYVTTVINKNISNYSAWHQRVQLITNLFKEHELNKKEMKKMVLDEISYITNAIYTDADDQSVWFYTNWFIENDIVRLVLTNEEYMKMLGEMKENIILINNDDLEFSGKENNWCLKMLIVIEGALKSTGHAVETDHTKEYLNKLIDLDPQRKNRYLYLLSK